MERISSQEQLDELLEPFSGATWETPRGGMNYSLVGEARHGTVLLIAGLSMQRTDWSPEFIAGLHAAGYATLAADNRDCGLTTLRGNHAEASETTNPVPDHTETAKPRRTEYALRDLAVDLRELLVHLDTGPVHAVGMSMGGMIAQHLALLAPDLVLSLTSLMSTTGNREVGHTKPESRWVFLTPAPTESLAAYVDYAVRYQAALSGGSLFDADRVRELAMVSWQRGINTEGTVRQIAAIQADGDRTERLASLRVPTLVLHGDADPLIGVSGGIATAAAIPGAELHIIEGMGHAVSWHSAAELTDRVVAHCRATSQSAPLDGG